MEDLRVDEDDFKFPLQVSTHERCGDPCPEFRDRIEGRDEFELVGMWGPFVETASGETIAEGHNGVRTVLNAVLDIDMEPSTAGVCGVYDCENDATHTVEINTDHKRFTQRRCEACLRGPASIAAVNEGLETKLCDDDRCFNVIHEARAYCTSHDSG